MYQIIADNRDFLSDDLAKGGSLVIEFAYFQGANPRLITHFAVVRANRQGTLYIKNSGEYAYKTPRDECLYQGAEYFKDLLNEVFNEALYAFNMELILVRMYICKRSNPPISIIDKMPFSS